MDPTRPANKKRYSIMRNITENIMAKSFGAYYRSIPDKAWKQGSYYILVPIAIRMYKQLVQEQIRSDIQHDKHN